MDRNDLVKICARHNSNPLNRDPPPLTSEIDACLSAQQAAARAMAGRLEVQMEASAQRRLAALGYDLGARYSFDRTRLSRFEIYDQRQRVVIDALTAFLADESRNLILFGPVGTGKDHLLAAALYHAARRGDSCRWVNGQEFYGSVRDRMDSANSEADWFARWTAPHVLGISDPVQPVGELTPWRIELLYRLIDRRYRAMRATWVTLNVRSEEEADQRMSQQVFDRLREGAVVIPCFWPSYRARK